MSEQNRESDEENIEPLEFVEEEEEVSDINILPYQVEHFKKVLEILQNELAYLDVSSFGSGKTIVAIAIAITFKMGLIVFGPKTLIPQWKRYAKKYGIHIYAAMTYSALRGTEKTGISHDLLTRNGSDFFPTDVLEKCAKSGVLIVYDECHCLKNENDQLRAAATLSKEAARLARMGYNIRIAALSATPADKKENITCLFKILGIVLENNLYKYNRSKKTYSLEGLQEAINKCNRYDPNTTFHVICRPVNKTTSKLICHELYTRILKKYITSSMPQPPVEFERDIKNLFAIMPPEDVERMKKGALLFASATSYRPETGEIDYSAMNWGKITESRREIDSAKVNTFVRLAKERLEADPFCKVVLFFTYKRDMYRSQELLSKYGALVMNGDITDDDARTDLMNKFNRPDTKYRVFISNPKVGGVGVELDDKFGSFCRYVFLAPNYNFIDQFQATGRVSRRGTKSKAVIRFVYSKEFPYESSIFLSMSEKSKVARDLSQPNQKDIVFLGELQEEVEGESEMEMD